MEWFSLLNDKLIGILAELAVPEAYRSMVALGVLYLTAILLVAFFIYLLLRLGRGRKNQAGTLPQEQPAAKDDGVVQDTEAEIAPSQEAAEAEEAVEKPKAVVAPVAPQMEEAPSVAPEPEQPVNVLERLRRGLSKTQSSLVGRIDEVLRGRKTIDAELLEEIEEILVTADVGLKTTQEIVQSLEQKLDRQELSDAAALRAALRDELAQRLRMEAVPLDLEAASPFVIMVVGVNGVGKTTTIGKLAHQFTSTGLKVVLGAADTFRAAAADQLAIWAERAGVELVRHGEGGDPAAVAFDAAQAARARGADVLILDTAGRLHTKVNLMEELKKIRRVLEREIPAAPHETLLVMDATTGQNALVQARLFNEAVAVTGIALTKLDGTAKGGVVVAIGEELGIPVRYVGIGEKVEDLRHFEPDLFVEALFPEA